MSIPANSAVFNVVFEAVRGSSFNGDIGLDDIAVKVGTCPKSPGKIYFGAKKLSILYLVKD